MDNEEPNFDHMSTEEVIQFTKDLVKKMENSRPHRKLLICTSLTYEMMGIKTDAIKNPMKSIETQEELEDVKAMMQISMEGSLKCASAELEKKQTTGKSEFMDFA